MPLLVEGRTIRDTYEVERLLGEGAFAEVYRVKHRFLGRQAMKVFKTPGMSLDETVNALGEAVILSRLGHPNIVRVFDAGLIEMPTATHGFCTMEYVAGGSLQQFWQSYGAKFVPVETVIDIARQICRGLTVAHASKPPIVHRDIKPQNVLVGYEAEGLRVRISDFGLAKHANPLTLLVSARGTRCFKSPEAFTDFNSDSTAGDVWAVAVTMYLLLTDRFPFALPEDFGDISPRLFDQPLIPPSRLNVFVDPTLERMVLRGMALDPKNRYSTAQAMLTDLESWKPQNAETFAAKAAAVSSGTSKSALGVHSPADEHIARERVKSALSMARTTGQLREAADIIEEAFNKWPPLRSEYETQVKLWRRGILM
jgi:serine/threonine protein kinase